MSNRRSFLAACGRSALALPLVRWPWPSSSPAPRLPRPVSPDPAHGWHGASSVGMARRYGSDRSAARRSTGQPPLPLDLSRRFPDLRRHFVFEYYPWYQADPVRHWDQWDRVPPHDIASNYMPLLGPYDSLDVAVLEQHARWIVESGAGAINLSWWGPGSFEDRGVHTVMDVMAAHDLRVSFHLEPYNDERAVHFADDVLYLLREYGDKRRFDALLVLSDEGGAQGPVFKTFRTILPTEFEDCVGVVHPVSDHVPDQTWRQQTDRVRTTLRDDFDHVTLLADSLDFGRTPAAGFDGVAVYDAFVRPDEYEALAREAGRRELLVSFSINAGYDGIAPRQIDPDDVCAQPTSFEPDAAGLDLGGPGGAEIAALLSAGRIDASFAFSLSAQDLPGGRNHARGFLLAYIGTFNEWHEGTSFEPMKDAADLTTAERSFEYHNPADGGYRLARLRTLLAEVSAPAPTLTQPRA